MTDLAMNWGSGNYGLAGLEGAYSYSPRKDGLTMESVLQEEGSITNFLRGKGYLGHDARLNLIRNPTLEDAALTIWMLKALVQHQNDDTTCRAQLHDQMDKFRVMYEMEKKKSERMEMDARKLQDGNKSLQSQLLALKHKSEEVERELRQKLQSANARLNSNLSGSKDAWNSAKRGGAGAAVQGPGGPARRVPGTYDRFRDDPAEAAASMQQLERDNAVLREQVASLNRRLAAASAQQQGRAHRDQAVRAVLLPEGDQDRGGDTAGARTPREMQLERMLRETQGKMEALQAERAEHLRQLDKAVADRAELTKTLHSVRSKNAALETERRNAEDRLARAQASLLHPPATPAAEAQLQKALADKECALKEANARCLDLQQRLAATEERAAREHRYVEVLKGAVAKLPALKGGEDPRAVLRREVEDAMAPVHEELTGAKGRVLELEAQVAVLQARQSANPSSEHPGCTGSPYDQLPLSPAVRFDGFTPGPLPSSGSPSLVPPPPPVLQTPPASRAYQQAFAASMPSPPSAYMGREHDQQQQQGAGAFTRGFHPVRTDDDAAATGSATGPCGAEDAAAGPSGNGLTRPMPSWPDGSPARAGPAGAAGGAAGAGGASAGPYVRRSLSAGVMPRPGVGVSQERRRWQVPCATRDPSPTPLEVMLGREVVSRTRRTGSEASSMCTPLGSAAGVAGPARDPWAGSRGGDAEARDMVGSLGGGMGEGPGEAVHGSPSRVFHHGLGGHGGSCLEATPEEVPGGGPDSAAASPENTSTCHPCGPLAGAFSVGQSM